MMPESNDNVWIALINAIETANFSTKAILILGVFLVVSMATGNGANLFKMIGSFTKGVKNIILDLMKKYTPDEYKEKIHLPISGKVVIYKLQEIMALPDDWKDRIMEYIVNEISYIRKNSRTPLHLVLNMSDTDTITDSAREIVGSIIRDVQKSNVIRLTIVFSVRPSKSMNQYRKELNDMYSENPNSWEVINTKTNILAEDKEN